VSHYDVQPTIDIFGTTQDRDLGSVAYDIDQIVKETANEVPKGFVRGRARAGQGDERLVS
jgi:hypothetical protein